MRILQLIHATQLRGAEIFACQLSEHLSELGNEVHIFSLYDNGSAMPTCLPVTTLNSKKPFDLKSMRSLSDYIKQKNIEVVQTNAGDTLKFAGFSKLFFKWKAKLIVRNATTMSELIKHRLHKFSYNVLFRKVDHVISVSQHEAEDIQMLFPHCRSKTTVIPIGIEKNQTVSFRNERNAPILLHAGAFSKEKNHEGLLRIFEKVLQHIPNAQLWLAGTGKLFKHIQHLASAMKISNHIRFLGQRNDINTLMQHADLLVLPSITEGLPGVILEAMCAGLPVISNDTGGIKEVIHNDRTGWLIQKHDEKAFAKKIIEVLNMPASFKQQVILDAKQLVSENHDNKNISQHFYALYERVVNA